MRINWLLILVISLPGFPLLDLNGRQRNLSLDSHAEDTTGNIISASSGQAVGTHLYIPQLYNPDRITLDNAIWAHNSPPADHEVALFRHSFSLIDDLEQTELHLFSDTRYEVWLDGNWIGRGPARFSGTLHEYDVYPLGSLPPGEHLLAVLVQWAPNIRRSESVRPHLVAHIQGQSGGKFVVEARSGLQWKCQLSNAWQGKAALVHTWGLIGPTELLDLRKLPTKWNQPGFDDGDWTNAVLVGAPQSVFRLRSIPHIIEQRLIPTLIDAGATSPGYRIGEITPSLTDPFVLYLSNSISATFSIQALDVFSDTAENIKLDGSLLAWEPVDPDRPDLYTARLSLPDGEHKLRFENIPAGGLTFSVPSQQFRYEKFPFSQGLKAGRRTLLASLESDPSQVNVSQTTGLNLEFPHLPSYAVLDLGKTVIGRLEAQVEGPAGTVVDIGWDERLAADSLRPLPYLGKLHPEWNQVDSWVLDGSSRTISTIDARAGRYILIALWGDGVVKIKDIRVLEERYPSSETGSFSSSNPRLDHIWQVGLDSLRPNMLDAYTDTPWRERGQWWGDAFIAEHINRVSLGDTQLLKRGLTYVADGFTNSSSPGMAPNSSGTHILDYSMLWVINLSEYVRLTGDKPFLREMYPVLLQFIAHLATYEDQSSQLLDLPQAHWSQTAYIERLAAHSRYGMSTALNAVYYGTLQAAADLADQADDVQRAAVWRKMADRVRQKVNELLYLPTENRYATSIYQGEIYPATPHAQAWALAYELVPPDRVDQVAGALLELLSSDPRQPNLDIYGMYWVLEALGRSDHIPEALEVIDNYYSYLLDSGATTWWEHFNADRTPSASLSHVWGGSPTWFLTTYILGAQWQAPGTWSVKPAFSGVTRAAGSIHVGDGLLEVIWERQICDQGSIDITSTGDSSGELTIPFQEQIIEVARNGSVIWENDSAFDDGVHPSPSGLVIPLTGGHQTLSVHFDCSQRNDLPNRTVADPVNPEP